MNEETLLRVNSFVRHLVNPA